MRRLAPICAVLLLATALATFAAEPKTLTDVQYGKAGDTPLLLDIVLPVEPHKKPLPLVVWIHGGGWQGGSKSQNPAAWMVSRGYVVASVEYRMSREAIFPAQIHDCKAAIRFLRANASKYGVDAKHIGVWGASAGGHLSALLGTSGGIKELEGKNGSPGYSSRVQAVCDFFGPADLAKTASRRGITPAPVEALLGGPVDQKMELARQASPVTFISKDDPPFLIVHGELDKLVSIGQSEELYSALKKAGVNATFVKVKNAGHGFPLQGTEPSFEEIRDKVVGFFDKWLK